MRLLEGHEAVAVCPECAGGLPTPRMPAEILDGRVIRRDGADITEAFERGARSCIDESREESGVLPALAILKARSPSCGSSAIYDGSFSGRLTEGEGVFCAALRAAGVRVVDEEHASPEDFANEASPS